MVVIRNMMSLQQLKIYLAAIVLAFPFSVWAENSGPVEVSADACDDRQQGYDAKTMEYRAVDKASLIAVKSSGLIQKYDDKLSPTVLDIVAYRLIDEYLHDVKHEITHSSSNRVCVHVKANLVISPIEMGALIKEHKEAAEPARINPDAEVQMASEVAEEINKTTALKPQNLKEKKLLYIENIKFWDGSENNHYADILKELFSDSEYYFVTADKGVADYMVTPSLKKAEVDKIDANNHKMKMLIEIQVDATNEKDFKTIKQEQNHFVLFSADKDEQQVADTLIKKLLARAAKEVDGKLNRHIQNELEKNKVLGKK